MSQSYASAGVLLEPQMKDWLPSYVNITPDNGTVTARYEGIPGGMVKLFYSLTFGSGTTIGSSPTITLPLNAASHYISGLNWIGGAMLNDAGSQGNLGKVRIKSATTFDIVNLLLSSNEMRDDDITATNPFTWTTGDGLICTAMYEAAP